MRIVNALIVPDATLGLDTPEDRRSKQREKQRQQNARAIVSAMEEIPRKDLDFEALGGRVVEHVPTGRFFQVVGGEAAYAPHCKHYFTKRTGGPRCSGPLRRRAEPRSTRSVPPASSGAHGTEANRRELRKQALAELRSR